MTNLCPKYFKGVTFININILL